MSAREREQRHDAGQDEALRSDTGASDSVSDRRRLFFALWPDEELRQVLARRICRHLPRRLGRPVPLAHLHLTLVFLGNVPAARMACILEAGSAVSAPPFELILDRLGHWPRPRVLWAGPRHTPAALFHLVGALRRALMPCALALDERPFQAHMTLLRKVARAPEPLAEIEDTTWPVQAFALIESLPAGGGVHYRPVRAWPLAESPEEGAEQGL